MRPILFNIGPLPVHAYGVMLIIGFFLGMWRATRVAKRYGIEPSQVVDICVTVLFAGIIGARLLYLFLEVPHLGWGVFRDGFRIWEGGLSFHGGLVAAIAAVAGYVRIKKLPFLVLTDLLAPSLAIGYAFARIGCFLNGCCYGVATNLPWAVRFHAAETGELTPPSHPAQIYAFIINIIIFFILTRVERLRRRPGLVFVAYLVLYSVYRFGIEYIRRGVTAQVWFDGLTQAQVASLAGVAVFGTVLLLMRRHPLPKKA